MTDDPERDLTPAERAYISDVEFALRGLPGKLRRSLMQALLQNLAERPPCDSQSRLERDLGAPGTYAAELLQDADRAAPGSIARARRRHRATQFWSVVIAAVLIAGVVIGFRWWVTWDPGLSAPMGRLCAVADEADQCDQTGFVDMSVAETVQVPCRRGGNLFLTAGLSADSAVTVTGASIPGVPSKDDSTMSDQLLWLDGVQPWQRPDPEHSATPSHWPITVGPDGLLPELHFHLTLCRTGPHQSGSSQSFGSIEVHYRALGRDRTAIIPLNETIAVTVPPFH